MSKNLPNMRSEKTALFDKELIVREEIQIDKLQKLYPEAINEITSAVFSLEPGYKLDEKNNVRLLRDTTNDRGDPVKGICMLQGYYCPYFVGSYMGSNDPDEIENFADNVWMRITDGNDGYWIDEWFKFSDRFTFTRINVWNIPEMFTHIEYMTMTTEPVNALRGRFRNKLDFNILMPIAIY